jgi:predicted RND superfamily exporter protein
MAAEFRDRVERGFEGWGRIVAARPVTVLIASLVFVAACVAGLPRVTVDVSFEAFLQPDDSVRVAYESFREQFGRDERVIISAEPGPQSGPDGVFDLAFLGKLLALK